MSGISSLLLGLRKNDYIVLLTFSERFEINHWWIISKIHIFKEIAKSLCDKKGLVLSANMIESNKFDIFFTSFTYNKNSSGP